MKISYTLKTAINCLRAHKSRSGLTILGIVIGITAIIMVMAIGKGAENLILAEIQGFGSRTISVEPGREPQGPADVYGIFSDSLKEGELEAIKNPRNVRGENKVEPMMASIETVVYENETKRTNIYGGSTLLLEIFDVYPSEGTKFTDEDVKSDASVAIIGADVKDELFGFSQAVGQKIKIKNRNFKIVGVLPAKGTVMMMDVDDMVFVPYSTAQKYLLGINYYHAILVEAETEEMVPLIVRDIEATLAEMHNITDPDKYDFHVDTMEEAMESIGMVTSILTLLLVSVAAISLIVGGIGIMNIMLVSVTERTREIGLRKALGATDKDILRQFLVEAIILTVIGGGVGIFLGAMLSWLISLAVARFALSGWIFVFPVQAAILGLGVAAGVGLIFGLYPAKQAAKKSPIEALRYE